MSYYTMSFKSGNIFAGETDQLWLPSEARAGKYGAILLHGATAPNQFADHTRWGSVPIPAALAKAGIPSVAGVMGGDVFANDPHMTRITAAKTYLTSNSQASPSKVHLIGISMGAGAAIRWASQNPTLVASVTAIIPMVNISDIYVNDKLGQRAAIGTAWGVTYPTALPAGADLLTQASTIKNNGIPGRILYSDADAVINVSDVTAMAGATGWTAIENDPVNSGHTETTINGMGGYSGTDWSYVVSFLLANGA